MKYVKTITVEAIPMTVGEYLVERGLPTKGCVCCEAQGYRLQYKNGRTKWEPTWRFEKSYRPASQEVQP